MSPSPAEHDATTPLRTLLRAATSALHDALDRRLALVPEADAGSDVAMTRGRYAAFLRGSLRVVAPLEARVAQWLPQHFPDDGPTRSEALREDLEALDVSQDTAPASSELLPAIDGEAAAFGAAYVMEGSALGGLHLARALRTSLGLGDDTLHYLTLRGDETGAHFKGFVAALDAFGAKATAHEREHVCRAARSTFEAYARAYALEGALARRA